MEDDIVNAWIDNLNKLIDLSLSMGVVLLGFWVAFRLMTQIPTEGPFETVIRGGYAGIGLFAALLFMLKIVRYYQRRSY